MLEKLFTSCCFPKITLLVFLTKNILGLQVLYKFTSCTYCGYNLGYKDNVYVSPTTLTHWPQPR